MLGVCTCVDCTGGGCGGGLPVCHICQGGGGGTGAAADNCQDTHKQI